MERPETEAGSGFPRLPGFGESGTILGWLPYANRNVSQTHIASMDSGLWKRCEESSAIPLPVSSPWFDAQKNEEILLPTPINLRGDCR